MEANELLVPIIAGGICLAISIYGIAIAKDRFYPLGGKPNSKTYFCNEGYGLVKYQSDRFGFRN